MKTETTSPPRRRLRYFLITLAAFAATVAIFYAEEDFRGWRVKENCARELVAQGYTLNWKSYTPAPVPDDENVFGVPKIQEGFTGRGSRNFTKHWPDISGDDKRRMEVAHLILALPGATVPAGANVFPWGDAKAQAGTIRLIKEAIGPVALNPAGGFYPKQPADEIRAPQIYLQCQSQPDEKALKKFLPEAIYNSWDNAEALRVERASEGTYTVTMHTPFTAAEFLKMNESLNPDFALVRAALRRPYARMNGDYSRPSVVPIPNFVTMRTVAQRLGAMAECHLLLGQPDEALQNMIFLNELCRRILEDNRPMTLVSAMINVAIKGLQAGIIADGFAMRAWHEPQLTALQEQFKAINVMRPVKTAFFFEQEVLWNELGTMSWAELQKELKRSDLVSNGKRPAHRTWSDKLNATLNDFGESYSTQALKLIPRGWNYQNMAIGTKLYRNVLDTMDPTNQIFLPVKAAAASKQMDKTFAHWSPYTFMAAVWVPNFTRAYQTTAQNQTLINQVIMVCALERYHLAHGEYPETLDALVPQFIEAIPHDIVGGQPPHYHRKDDGTFLLYSIGWSEQDHGGAPKSDLVWPPEK